jgi:hypothetical protein
VRGCRAYPERRWATQWATLNEQGKKRQEEIGRDKMRKEEEGRGKKRKEAGRVNGLNATV